MGDPRTDTFVLQTYYACVMASETKPTVVQVRLTDEQIANLDRLAESLGLDRSSLMRSALDNFTVEAERMLASKAYDAEWEREFGPMDETLVAEMDEYLSK